MRHGEGSGVAIAFLTRFSLSPRLSVSLRFLWPEVGVLCTGPSSPAWPMNSVATAVVTVITAAVTVIAFAVTTNRPR